MDLCILAAYSGTYSIGGVLCLASIPIFIIALLIMAKCGPIGGSGLCGTICVIFILANSDPTNHTPGDNISDNILSNNAPAWITNSKQTEWLNKNNVDLDEEGSLCYFSGDTKQDGKVVDEDSSILFIPANEMYDNGTYVMKSNRRPPCDRDYYLYKTIYPNVNVPFKYGGGGIPQWVYHPASPIYIFGLFGLPVMLAGGFIVSKAR